MLTHTLSFLSWNIRGLGQNTRCEDVLSELIAQRPSIVALQETKLHSLSDSKRKSFLPTRLSTYTTRPSVGATGGILTSLSRSVSDHVPLLLTASTKVPKGACFRFEDAKLHHAAFKDLMQVTLANHSHGSSAQALVKRLKNCHRACRSWSRQLWPLDQRENDTKSLVDALDLLEEVRPLHHSEDTLRRLTIQGLQAINQERLAFWRQRFNLCLATEWDENSNGRHRSNKIHTLEIDGVSHTSHDAKQEILHDYYKNLLDSPTTTHWNFDLRDLYPTLSVANANLSAPFDPDEITQALFVMDMNASPGPNGFDPSFYKAFWSQLKPSLVTLFADFHGGQLDLDGLNRAHLILLPKKEGVRTPDGSRPISLQNCPMKLFSKVMTNRLKLCIRDRREKHSDRLSHPYHSHR
ncbi:hypothetical protein HU200_050391 [Digitaria exilis]|uniref:Endonuclease/exonuclease/phosphatase domain-containing protein n=1 Tax=Digitaria exilis TaxID=1010633 RepID=A0A835B2P9_9POAL|nr:hypothetical protein HU200_050391 [Digitaria exilis]